ncbi:sterol O-acyltransferase 1-like [Acanthaster planci]|uniref:O-acyltransferase n=1 Tax=Acanthaster planci TaxID=133434 RepID=A0A8B7XLZ5_ACAPL|nr:sterol O-acyltransferase 1-like [Acanthaster planci]XP_022081824.1 sterol O-acyltransferase 1-like [Acanthaster planci]XP_022081833.1 sterol O-acyltransferase 1-like [Acanthaster planci]
MKVGREAPLVDDHFGASLDKEMNVLRVRHAAQKVRAEFLGHLDGHLEGLLESFVGELEKQTDLKETEEKEAAPRPKPGDQKQLKEKVFVARESLLTQLLVNKNIRTIYNIFVAMLIVFVLNTAVYEYIENGSIKLNLDMLLWQFGQFPVVLSTWCVMMMWTMVVTFVMFQYWATNRHKPNRIPDGVWLCVYFASQLFMVVFPLWAVLAHQLPPASTIIVIAEQLRLIMKTHSFIRENVPRALRWKPHPVASLLHRNGLTNPQLHSTNGQLRTNGHMRSNSEGCPRFLRRGNGVSLACQAQPGTNSDSGGGHDGSPGPCPDFSHFLYFLFAPTLIYRDRYPRTPRIRWHVVNTNFLQVLACLFYTYYTFERFCVPVFRNFSQETLTVQRLILCVFSCVLPGTLVLILAFFAILHSWMNAFAEMMRFADRQFYKDWWNCKSYANYYRTWNIVVHDWLYTYIYRDFQLLQMRKSISMMAVFVISALVHEYVLSLAFGFFFPVLMVLFGGVGFMFIFIPSNGSSNVQNILVWLSLFIGNGILMCLYSQEWYARQHCQSPDGNLTFLDAAAELVVPKSFFCNWKF